MNIALNDDLKSFVDARVKARGYSSYSEYVRDLVRKDAVEAGKEKLRRLIEEGLESPPGPLMSDAIAELRAARTLKHDRRKSGKHAGK